VIDGSMRAPEVTAHAAFADVRMSSVKVKALTLDGEGSKAGGKITVTGVGADPKEKLDLTASATRRDDGQYALTGNAALRSLDLDFLRKFAAGDSSPLSAAAGTIDADVDVGGTLAAPTGKISATLHEGRFLLGDDIQRLDKTTLEANLDAGALTLVALDARAGEGTLAAHGVLKLVEPGGLEMDVGTDRFGMVAGANILEISTNLHLTAQREGAGWEGVATLRGTTVNMPKSRTVALQPLGALEDVHFVDAAGRQHAEAVAMESMQAPPPESTTHVHIETPEEIHVTSPEVDATLVTDHLSLESAYGRVAIFGDVDVTGGTFKIEDRPWDIRKAHASFDGSFPVDAAIDVHIAHDFDTVSIDVGLSGSIRHPVPSLSASPPIYDDQQILAILMGGEPDDPSLSSGSMSSAAAGLGANMVLGPVRKAIQEFLPVDVLRLTVENNSDTGEWKVGGEAGGHLGKNVQILYHYRPPGSVASTLENEHELILDWAFHKHWLLEGRAGDQNGELDVLWSFRR
jgi:translocation and assembly module TamB